MTPQVSRQISRNRSGWRRAVASAAIATGLMAGLGSGIASADVLDDIAGQYDLGAGGGQVANLIHDALKLRALGFLPSRGNYAALQEGMDKRPNQMPLIIALEETVAFQRKTQARTTGPSDPVTVSINQYNPNYPPLQGGFGFGGYGGSDGPFGGG